MLMFDPVPIKQEAMDPVSVVRQLKYISLYGDYSFSTFKFIPRFL